MTGLGRRLPGIVGIVLTAVLAGLLAVVLVGCGVPLESAPEGLPDVRAAQAPTVPPSSSPSPGDTSGAAAQIFLLQQGRLVAVPRSVSDPQLPGPVLDALLAGPTQVEVGRSITTAIPARTPSLEVTISARGTASIVVPPSFETLQVAAQILVVAQLVYTLTGIDGITGLQLTHGTEVIDIPTGDGRLTRGPVFRAAYSSLGPRGPAASLTPTSPPVRQGGL